MQKIISILLSISIFVIVGLQSAMAHFVVIDNFEVQVQHSEMEMMGDDCCETMQDDCNQESHECCYSPFQNSSVTSNIQFQINQKEKLKIKLLDYSFLAILNEDFQINYIEKLTAPPNDSLTNGLENTYTILTGITKSNC